MSFEPLENFFDFLDTPERMQKKCDDLEREIKNDPTDEKKKEILKTMKEIMRRANILYAKQEGGKSRCRRRNRYSSKKHKKARKSRRRSRS